MTSGLMLLIASKEHSKITKQVRMKFMEVEFDRVDKDKSGFSTKKN
jgi:hypothetical protein